MSHTANAVASIAGRLSHEAYADGGTSAATDFDFGEILSKLLSSIINTCLGGLTATETAHTLVSPSPQRHRQFRAAARRESVKHIGRGKGLRAERRKFADDLVESMSMEAAERGFSGTLKVVREVRQ